MSFFPRSSYLGLYGGELHRKGGVLLKARLKEWERELQYLRFRIAEWKEFGSVEHPDYYPFRTFLLQKVRNHLYFELKTLSSILVACEVAVRSDDVPPLQSYANSIFAFRERISPGEITRRIHVEEWHRYCRTKEEVTDTPSQMDDMFARIRNEIGAMERRSGDFKRMVDELVGLVDEMQERERMGGFVNGLARSPRNRATRSNLVHSSSDLPSTLSDTRTRLPPTPSLPLSGSATTPESPSRPLNARPTPTSGSSSSSLLRRAASSQSVTAGSSIASSRTPPPPRPARHPHRRLFNRMFYVSGSPSGPLPRLPSPSRTSSPPRSNEPTAPRENLQARLIAETRTRLPPPPETNPNPILYQPPGQRLFSFLHRS